MKHTLGIALGVFLVSSTLASAMNGGGGGGGSGCIVPQVKGTLRVKYPFAGAPSYFRSTVEIGTYIDGTFPGWCSDTSRTINENTNYSVKIFTDYESLPAGAVDFPQNFDQVNWILNRAFVGKASPGGFGTYTYGDAQKAIWTLLETHTDGAGLGEFNAHRVAEILALAATEGRGFAPFCDDLMAVVLVPEDEACHIDAQVTFIPVTPRALGCCTPKRADEG